MVIAAPAKAVDIETVPVGNTGNSDDTHGDGYGAVNYQYNIGKYEVTAGQYCEFLNAVAATDTYGLYNTDMNDNEFGCQITRKGSNGSYTYDFSGRPSGTDGDWANRPVTYVSWGDAARFANWLHNGQPNGAQDASTTEDGAYELNGANDDAALVALTREPDWKWAITSEDEWYKAAYHKNNGDTGDYFDYPTSSDATPSNALIDPDPGNNATFLDGGRTIGRPYYRTEVGAHENSDSPYGTFDQGGNVWEWNEAVIIGFSPGLRGGSFDDIHHRQRAWERYPVSPTVEYNTLGFRVSEVPEPATLSLLAPAGLAVLRRRRRSPRKA